MLYVVCNAFPFHERPASVEEHDIIHGKTGEMSVEKRFVYLRSSVSIERIGGWEIHAG